MIAAIQDASFAAWDAVVASEFNDDLPTYPPTYIQQQAWKAALDAAPEAPSAEPCPYVRSSSEGTHWCALAEQPTDHREVMKLEHQRNNLLIIMQQALDALEQSRPLTSEDDFVLLVRQHQQAIKIGRAHV
jgi:hypothetical protein